MSEGVGVKYGCRCGETVFDLSGRATGDVLTCPFCKRQYFFWGASQIELLDQPIDTASPDAYRAETHAKSTSGEASKDVAKPSDVRANEPKKDGPAEAEAPGGPRRRRFYEIQKADAPERPAAPPKPSSRGGVASSRNESAAPPRKRLFFLPDTSKPIPGGFFPMVVCILGGNVVAFLALYSVLPADPDGTRLAPWGTIPKSAIWPELAAIVVGHLIGFAVWAVFVGIWIRRQRAQSKTASGS